MHSSVSLAGSGAVQSAAFSKKLHVLAALPALEFAVAEACVRLHCDASRIPCGDGFVHCSGFALFHTSYFGIARNVWWL